MTKPVGRGHTDLLSQFSHRYRYAVACILTHCPWLYVLVHCFSTNTFKKVFYTTEAPCLFGLPLVCLDDTYTVQEQIIHHLYYFFHGHILDIQMLVWPSIIGGLHLGVRAHPDFNISDSRWRISLDLFHNRLYKHLSWCLFIVSSFVFTQPVLLNWTVLALSGLLVFFEYWAQLFTLFYGTIARLFTGHLSFDKVWFLDDMGCKTL